ncbi:hypothetical protein V1478_005985 [Vespula squamosa]|uniref:Uncharacterized protein n=1 Tax=Vespula squamosa TaxID=30214 RepID=A0ABD2B8Y7_VESSQ
MNEGIDLDFDIESNRSYRVILIYRESFSKLNGSSRQSCREFSISWKSRNIFCNGNKMNVRVSPNHTSCIIVRVEHRECYSVVSHKRPSAKPSDFLFPFSRDEVHITRISMFAVALTSGVYLSYGYEVIDTHVPHSNISILIHELQLIKLKAIGVILASTRCQYLTRNVGRDSEIEFPESRTFYALRICPRSRLEYLSDEIIDIVRNDFEISMKIRILSDELIYR